MFTILFVEMWSTSDFNLFNLLPRIVPASLFLWFIWSPYRITFINQNLYNCLNSSSLAFIYDFVHIDCRLWCKYDFFCFASDWQYETNFNLHFHIVNRSKAISFQSFQYNTVVWVYFESFDLRFPHSALLLSCMEINVKSTVRIINIGLGLLIC